MESPIIPLVVLTVFTALCIWRGVGIEVDPDLKA
ncbi:MAG: hypothetical protein ACI82G_001797, partial [Bradymonadia bacterium]